MEKRLPLIGDPAPAFQAKTTHGPLDFPKDYKGKWVALPAGWPENELLKDRVIVPPPSSEEGAKKRLEEAKAGKVECYDWWFCHKKLEGRR
jgi:alkyl hydroperoxide reductase subunit AhpC